MRVLSGLCVVDPSLGLGLIAARPTTSTAHYACYLFKLEGDTTCDSGRRVVVPDIDGSKFVSV